MKFGVIIILREKQVFGFEPKKKKSNHPDYGFLRGLFN